MFRNYLNLTEAELDQPIYRIIPVQWLEELFVTGFNVLVNPREWDDPFENFILKSKIRFDAGEIGEIGFSDDYYAQCWSFHKASDAMWRIYSPNKDGVRIKTTIRKLAGSLSANLNEWKNSQCFIGKVRYLPNKKLLAFANTALTGMPSSSSFANTLLVKRPAFSHEKEVRLIYFDKNNTENHRLFRYSINAHDLIDQIMIDPRLTETDANILKGNILKSTGFKGKIKRSLLYAPPKNMVFKFG